MMLRAHQSLATVRRVPNEPVMAAKVFTMLAEAGVNVDMIVQASASTGTADISFTVPGTAAAKVQEVLQEKQDELGYQSFDIDANVGKVAVVRRSLRSGHVFCKIRHKKASYCVNGRRFG